MAKSLRSKWKRKMRGVKREQYAKKDLVKLKALVEAAEQREKEEEKLYKKVKVDSKTVEMKDVENGPVEPDEEGMEVDKKGRKFDPKTYRDEHGNYPVWMNQRQIKKHKKANKVAKKQKKEGKGKAKVKRK